MWQCPNCVERHEDQFETCWKCGSRATGESDPEFEAVEPLDAKAQLPEPDAESALPSLEFPAFTYYALPFVVWAYSILPLRREDGLLRSTPYPLSMTWQEVVLAVATMVLVWIPIALTMFPCLCRPFLELHGRKPRTEPLVAMLWMLSAFRLPKTIASRHRWFVPVYYVSWAAPMVVLIGAVI